MKEAGAKVGKYKVEMDAERHPFLVNVNFRKTENSFFETYFFDVFKLG